MMKRPTTLLDAELVRLEQIVLRRLREKQSEAARARKTYPVEHTPVPNAHHAEAAGLEMSKIRYVSVENTKSAPIGEPRNSSSNHDPMLQHSGLGQKLRKWAASFWHFFRGLLKS